MKLKQLFAIAIVGILGSILIFAAVFAQGGSERPYLEGEGAVAGGSRVVVGSAEGQSEGLVGASGQLQGDAAAAWLAAAQVPDDLTLLYRFTGVTDDGEQGSGNRKAATAIHCTNLASLTNQVYISVYQWNGSEVYTATVDLPAGQTATYSTQETEIYANEQILGGSPGTDVIDQGSGAIYANNSQIICTVQSLDPLSNPPSFVSNLQLFRD